MKRTQLEAVLREAQRICGGRELVVIGSQCVHAVTDAAPAEVLMSRECDVLLDEADEAAVRLDAEIGEASAYREEHGVYVDTVSSTFPFLPDGWEERLRTLDGNVRCLEIHDLVLSKLAAGRLKDYELIAALLAQQLAHVDVARERIGAVSDLHMRAILLARIHIVLESVGNADP